MLIFYSFDSYPEGSSQKWEFGIKNSFLFFFLRIIGPSQMHVYS